MLLLDLFLAGAYNAKLLRLNLDLVVRQNVSDPVLWCWRKQDRAVLIFQRNGVRLGIRVFLERIPECQA